MFEYLEGTHENYVVTAMNLLQPKCHINPASACKVSVLASQGAFTNLPKALGCISTHMIPT